MIWFILGIIVGIWLSFHDWPATVRRSRERYTIHYRRRQKLLHPFLRDEPVNTKLWDRGINKGVRNVKKSAKR